MTQQKIYLVLIVAMGFVACKSDSSGDSDGLSALPAEKLEELTTSCDGIDIIFYNSPMSMAQDESRAIQATLSYISPNPATPKPECEPMARISFIGSGVMLADANIYCTQGCTYFEFMEGDEAVYANALSDQGIQFFSGILKQIHRPQ